MRKRTKIIATSILSLCIIAIIGTLFFLGNQSTKEKELPDILEVKDYHDYTEEEMEQIFFQSEYSNVGTYLSKLSEEEQKDIKKKFSYLTEKRVKVYYKTDSGETDYYTTTPWEISMKQMKEEEEFEAEQQKLLASKSETSQSNNEGMEQDASEAVLLSASSESTGTSFVDAMTANMFEKLDNPEEDETVSEYLSRISKGNNLLKQNGGFFINVCTMGNQKYNTSSNTAEDMPSGTTTTEADYSKRNEEAVAEDINNRLNANSVKFVLSGMKLPYIDSSGNEEDSDTFSIEMSPTASSPTTIGDPYNFAFVDKILAGPKYSQSRKSGSQDPTSGGNYPKSNNASIFILYLKYNVPYNVIPMTSSTFDNSGLGRYSFNSYTGYYKNNGTSYYDSDGAVDTLGFNNVASKLGRDVPYATMLTNYRAEQSNHYMAIDKIDSDGALFKWTDGNDSNSFKDFEDRIQLQINVQANASNGRERVATLKYWATMAEKYSSTPNKFYAELKSQYDGTNADDESVIAWLTQCYTNKSKEGFSSTGATKSIILAPAYNKLVFNSRGGVLKGKDVDLSDTYNDIAEKYNFSSSNLAVVYGNEASTDVIIEKNGLSGKVDTTALNYTGKTYKLAKDNVTATMNGVATKQIDIADANIRAIQNDDNPLDVRTSVVRRGYTVKDITIINKDNADGDIVYTSNSSTLSHGSNAANYKTSITTGGVTYDKAYRLYSAKEQSLMGDIYKSLQENKESAYDLTNYTYLYASTHQTAGSNSAQKSFLFWQWENTAPIITWNNKGSEPTVADTSDTKKMPDDTIFKDSNGNTCIKLVNGVKAGEKTLELLTDALGNSTNGMKVTDTEDTANDTSGLKVNKPIPELSSYTITESGSDTTSISGLSQVDKIFIDSSASNSYQQTIPAEAISNGLSSPWKVTLRTYDYAETLNEEPVVIYIYLDGEPIKTPTPSPNPAPTPAAGEYHTGHCFTTSELLEKCPDPSTPSKYVYSSEKISSYGGLETGSRANTGSYTVTKTTTYSHSHSIANGCYYCPGHYHSSSWGSWTTYCSGCRLNCNLPATKKINTQCNISVGNCVPYIEVRKNLYTKTVNGKATIVPDITEKEILTWNYIIDSTNNDTSKRIIRTTPCDHEDTKIHLGSGTSCSTCSSTSRTAYSTIWKNISNASVSGSKYTFVFSGTNNASSNAKLVIDIGKLQIGKHNPGGTYDIIFTLTDGDGATYSETAKFYVDWTAPLITVNKEISANGLIYHTNDKIPQLDFYSSKVITKAYDYMDVDAVEGNKPLGLAAGTHISSDLTTLKDSDGYPKYIKILDTKTLYVKMKGSEEVCNIKNTEQQTPAENWRAANSVVSEKIFEISIRCYNPRNSDYYTDVEGIKVKVVNDAPTVGMGDHLLVLYEEWTEDLIVDFPSTMAWDYEDGTIEDKDSQNITYGTETFTSKDGTQRVRKGIEKTSSCLIPNGTYLPNGNSSENTADGKANYNVRSKGDPYRLRFKIVDWGGKDVFVAANGYTYFNTNYEGRFKCTMRFYDLDGAYADRDFWVEVRKTEAQRQPHLRFINKYFFYQDEAFGGLASDSIWRTNPEYYNELKTSLETDVTNSDASNNWAGCQRVYIYTADDIKEAKEIIKKHTVDKGAGNGTWDFNAKFIEFMNRHRVK